MKFLLVWLPIMQHLTLLYFKIEASDSNAQYLLAAANFLASEALARTKPDYQVAGSSRQMEMALKRPSTEACPIKAKRLLQKISQAEHEASSAKISVCENVRKATSEASRNKAMEEAAWANRLALYDVQKEVTLRQNLCHKYDAFIREENCLRKQERAMARAKEEMEQAKDHLNDFLRLKDDISPDVCSFLLIAHHTFISVITYAV